MRIAYFSLDDVNRALVRRWAAGQGVRVVCPSVRAVGEPVAAATVVDLDFLPDPYRVDWIAQVLAGAVEVPVLVHGHRLTDAEAASLARRGVVVCRGRLRRMLEASADLDEHAAALQKYVDMGFDSIYIHNVGRNQAEFIAAFGEKVLPQLRLG